MRSLEKIENDYLDLLNKYQDLTLKYAALIDNHAALVVSRNTVSNPPEPSTVAACIPNSIRQSLQNESHH